MDKQTSKEQTIEQKVLETWEKKVEELVNDLEKEEKRYPKVYTKDAIRGFKKFGEVAKETIYAPLQKRVEELEAEIKEMKGKLFNAPDIIVDDDVKLSDVHMGVYKAWSEENECWYHWTFIIPDNLEELCKREGLTQFQKLH